jgi:hypothetical protein
MSDNRPSAGTDVEREAFERFIVRAGFTDWTRHTDGYSKPIVDRLWRAWPSDHAQRGNYEDRHPNDMVLHPLTEIREWDEALAVLGIQDSDQTPADAIRELNAEIERLSAPAQCAPDLENLANRFVSIIQDGIAQEAGSKSIASIIINELLMLRIISAAPSVTSTSCRTLSVMVPDKNSASGYRVGNLSIEVDADLAKALDGSALPATDRGGK